MVLSIDSCLALQCAPLSRTATLLWTSSFLLCAARLFWPAYLFLSLWAVTQSLSGCCLRMCPINHHLPLLTSTLNLSTLALSSSSLLPILSCHLIFIYPSQASVLKHIDFLSITFVHFPCFATIHENWFDQCFV